MKYSLGDLENKLEHLRDAGPENAKSWAAANGHRVTSLRVDGELNSVVIGLEDTVPSSAQEVVRRYGDSVRVERRARAVQEATRTTDSWKWVSGERITVFWQVSGITHYNDCTSGPAIAISGQEATGPIYAVTAAHCVEVTDAGLPSSGVPIGYYGNVFGRGILRAYGGSAASDSMLYEGTSHSRGFLPAVWNTDTQLVAVKDTRLGAVGDQVKVSGAAGGTTASPYPKNRTNPANRLCAYIGDFTGGAELTCDLVEFSRDPDFGSSYHPKFTQLGDSGGTVFSSATVNGQLVAYVRGMHIGAVNDPLGTGYHGYYSTVTGFLRPFQNPVAPYVVLKG